MRTVKEAAERLKDLFDAVRRATEQRQARLARHPMAWEEDDLVGAVTRSIRDVEASPGHRFKSAAPNDAIPGHVTGWLGGFGGV
jgi:hypothetical protein